MKTCTKCGTSKVESEFYADRTRGRLFAQCKSCVLDKSKAERASWTPERKLKAKAISKQWRLDNPERYERLTRSARFKQNYGITIEEYDSMVAAQEGLCKICKTADGLTRLHVDHDHKTGLVRGLLCHRCNTAIGLLREDAKIMKTAIAYLDGESL